jgi:leucyl/phenylalanyl-tRNA--protein transferase
LSQIIEPPLIIPPALLLAAYRAGIFPMAEARDDPEIFWVEPKRRAVLPLDRFRCSHSLARTLRRGRFTVTCNTAFAQVVAECAAPRATEGGQSWISHRIAASYQRLHELGHAHSIECWADGELAGGLYGVGFAGAFCGESMFSRRSDASKVALAWLVATLKTAGAQLLDCQFLTPHLASLGAVEISQKRYMELLEAACGPVDTGDFELPAWEDRHLIADQSWGSGSAADADGLGAGAASAVLALPAAFAALLALAKSAGSSSSPGNFIAQSFTQTS